MREFQDAAKNDNVQALNYLGIMYAEGIGAARDDSEAAAMFAKAAMLGFPEAMSNLARMHALGRGVPQDNRIALETYRAAARTGFEPAIRRMIEIYEQGGLGEAPNAALAQEWRAQSTEYWHPVSPAASAPLAARALAAEVSPPRPLPPPPDMALVETIPAEPVAVARDDKSAAVATPQPVPQEPPAAIAAPAPPPTNTIEAIAVTVETGRVLIRVRSASPLTAAPAEFVVAVPPRIVFDFPHTVTGLGRHNEVGEGDLQSVDVIEGEGRTRMILILRNRMQHEMKLNHNELLITLNTASPGGN